MSRWSWPTLMRLGMVELRLPPDTFWSLTPAELILLSGLDAEGRALGRAGFEDLLARYPDAQKPLNEEN